MKRYPSPTVNGGTTIVLEALNKALEIGELESQKIIDNLSRFDPKQKREVGFINRNCQCERCGQPRAEHHVVKKDDRTKYFCKDKNGPTKEQFKEGKASSTKISMGSLLEQYRRMKQQFGECSEAISKGDPELKENISRLVEELHDLALDLAPSLRSNYSGFRRSDEGVTVAPELLAAGEEQCCFRRKEGAEGIKNGTGEGAYRIVLNTDVEWFGRPEDNAALIGALVILLQQFKPVEVWVQQGWLGESMGDGVTLFKLDFTGAFDPTQLAFWCGHPHKDRIFSFFVNRGLGRSQSHSATTSEIECDLYLRGDWMKVMGIEQMEFVRMLHTDKIDLMAKWISKTAVKMVFEQPAEPEITL